MKKKGRKSVDLASVDSKELNLEELRWIQRRMETHEIRYYQILLYCFTSFGLVLGFSDKINGYFIPLITTPLLLLSVRHATSNRIHQRFCSAFMWHKFYGKIEGGTFEGAYREVFITKKILRKNPARFFWSFINNSFLILFVLNLFMLYYFSWSYLLQVWCSNRMIAVIYVSYIFLINASVLINVYLGFKRRYTFWDVGIKSYLEK